MQDQKNASRTQGEESSTGPGAPAADDHLKKFEDALGESQDDIWALMEALPGMAAGKGSPVQGADGMRQIHTLGARVALLEESFARICTMVGRLEQEFLALKDRLAVRD